MKQHTQTSNSVGILLTNLGSPKAPTPMAVYRYLTEFLSDPRVVEIPRMIWQPLLRLWIAPLRCRKTSILYQSIWTNQGSPLVKISKEQATLLSNALNMVDPGVSVQCAMRYGQPSLEEAMNTFKKQGIQKIIVLPLYPQYSATTTASTFDKIASILKKWRWIPQLHFINHYADHPMYIAALQKSIEEHFKQQGVPEKIAFSFHGLPERTLELGDPYYCYCMKTTRLVVEALQLKPEQYTVCFQSQFGRAKWFSPNTQKTVVDWANQGVKSIAVVCPGFSADCLETLEEINQQYRKDFFRASGKNFSYIPALNTSPEHINLLSALVQPFLPKSMPPVSQ